MTSYEMRKDPLFLRNLFYCVGKWDIPLIKKQELPTNTHGLIACSDTRANDIEENRKKGVHFFVDDYRFSGIYEHPERSLMRYSQYAFLLSPDYSIYADMNLWKQLENVARNRWVGAFWQSRGLTVIPTISWGLAQSFDFCFNGVEQNSTVAIGMIGCKRSKLHFMRGYYEMLAKLSPSKIVCFGTPFPEMEGNIVSVDYRGSRKVVR